MFRIAARRNHRRARAHDANGRERFMVRGCRTRGRRLGRAAFPVRSPAGPGSGVVFVGYSSATAPSSYIGLKAPTSACREVAFGRSLARGVDSCRSVRPFALRRDRPGAGEWCAVPPAWSPRGDPAVSALATRVAARWRLGSPGRADSSVRPLRIRYRIPTKYIRPYEEHRTDSRLSLKD